jgi:hypothetical protein
VRPAGAVGLSTDEFRTSTAECQARALLLRKEDLGRLISKDQLTSNIAHLTIDFSARFIRYA